jgi:Spy/CpxP family protein refolding chaperone
MKRIAVIFLVLASAISLFAQSADPDSADEGKTGPKWMEGQMPHHFWARLGLTDDQKDKLKQIREADRDNLRSAWAQVKIAKESLKAALLANPENTAEIQAKATAVANALSTCSVQMALHLAKMAQVLTPAQRVEADEARHRMVMHRWHRHGEDTEKGPWQPHRDWERKDHSPDRTPSATPEGQAPDSSPSPT